MDILYPVYPVVKRQFQAYNRAMKKGKQRVESVYWQARGLALHEDEHLTWLEERLSP